MSGFKLNNIDLDESLALGYDELLDKSNAQTRMWFATTYAGFSLGIMGRIDSYSFPMSHAIAALGTAIDPTSSDTINAYGTAASGWKKIIALSMFERIGLKYDGTAYTWGLFKEDGWKEDGVAPRYTRGKLGGPSYSVKFKDIFANNIGPLYEAYSNHISAIDENGDVWLGESTALEFGGDPQEDAASAVTLGKYADYTSAAAASFDERKTFAKATELNKLGPWKKAVVASGRADSLDRSGMAIRADGSLWAWGMYPIKPSTTYPNISTTSEVGAFTYKRTIPIFGTSKLYTYTPVLVDSGEWIDIVNNGSYWCGIKKNGDVGVFGSFGTSASNVYSETVESTGLTIYPVGAKAFSSDGYYIIKSDGSLMFNAIHRKTLVELNVTSVASGGGSTAIVTHDGTSTLLTGAKIRVLGCVGTQQGPLNTEDPAAITVLSATTFSYGQGLATGTTLTTGLGSFIVEENLSLYSYPPTNYINYRTKTNQIAVIKPPLETGFKEVSGHQGWMDIVYKNYSSESLYIHNASVFNGYHEASYLGLKDDGSLYIWGEWYDVNFDKGSFDVRQSVKFDPGYRTSSGTVSTVIGGPGANGLYATNNQYKKFLSIAHSFQGHHLIEKI